MKVIGIIAEYNPFHNGHAWQIRKIREITKADYIVIAMSGDFVQRGAPAIIDKYARARMALVCGADLVIELPALWATSSAERFAAASVALFDKMSCVDGLCFGAETDRLPLLKQISDILVEESTTYQSALSSYLKGGLNFPSARARAVCDTFSQNTDTKAAPGCDASMPQRRKVTPETLGEILTTPNNILAIEYLKALKRRDSSVEPILLKREGAGYHEEDIRADSKSPAASATAIRKILLQFGAGTQSAARSTSTESRRLSGTPASLCKAMPPQALLVLNDYLSKNPAVQADDFSSILGYLLLSATPETLSSIGDCNTDIANRLVGNRMHFCSFTQFCEQNKSRDITYTRMSRILLHTILRFTEEDYRHFCALDAIPYLRILGLRRDSTALLREIKTRSAAPLVTKLASAGGILSGDALALLKKDIFAADLYEQIKAQKNRTTTRSEYARKIVVL
ncbi:MAG: nucleotidyltransferase family protein [Roseburia sp.]